MSGSNYKISYCQILESERRLQLSNLLKFLYIKQQSDNISLKEYLKILLRMTMNKHTLSLILSM